jgi:tRNA uridine 5-carboxymethylaminomethyl modification enzyme
MFNGRIQSVGPRYCPSIEDKIDRFADKDRHQMFIEPEGWDTVEVYVNGFSTSLPEDVQFKALRSVVGFEKVKFFRPGYAIEYDYFPPTQLRHTLETKLVNGLYFAGQINGTTGYEEAACQGLMAGINAALKVQGKEPFVLKRSEAYIGVLIDDLINKGTEEPYRMFTSRAEHRILLRQDNADLRLTEIGYKIGLASKERYEKAMVKKEALNRLLDLLSNQTVRPEVLNDMLERLGTTGLSQPVKAETVITRPQVSLKDMIESDSGLKETVQEITADHYVIEQAEIQIKYAGYIQKEFEMVEELAQKENTAIPESLDYSKIKSLSNEGLQKMTKIKPETIGQASRISGVSASDVSVLMVYLKG